MKLFFRKRGEVGALVAGMSMIREKTMVRILFHPLKGFVIRDSQRIGRSSAPTQFYTTYMKKITKKWNHQSAARGSGTVEKIKVERINNAMAWTLFQTISNLILFSFQFLIIFMNLRKGSPDPQLWSVIRILFVIRGSGSVIWFLFLRILPAPVGRNPTCY